MPPTWFPPTWWHFYPNGYLCGLCLNYCDIYGIQLSDEQNKKLTERKNKRMTYPQDPNIDYLQHIDFLNRNLRFMKIDDTQDTNSQPAQNNDSQTPQQIVHNMNQHTHTQSNINHINGINDQSPQQIVHNMNQHQHAQSNFNHINGQTHQQIVHNLNQHIQHALSNFN
ncbi:27595_t:CDS:1 [Racocetra persica]|uniref:27595_t:CDS:1 n=1 Tax=Racocetra persica TaxID=160502 RepID=A0ACA9SHA9_9GLOM|nr:27595_t:CDS:1 [Racocetra persica]